MSYKRETPTEPRPIIDYANLPYLPRTGVQAGGNFHYLTKGLFLETSKGAAKKDAIWCLAEHEVWAEGRWYPSAHLAYVYAKDEYDALLKIVGNLKAWENLKSQLWFQPRLEVWQAEHAFRQKALMKAALIESATSGKAGNVTAARAIIAMLDAPVKPALPKKKKQAKPEEAPAPEGFSHVVGLFDKRAKSE